MRTITSKQAVTNKRLIRGQGLTEYIIIVALIALASVGAVGFFGSSVKTQFVQMGSDLVGGSSQALATAKTDSASQDADAAAKATLGNY